MTLADWAPRARPGLTTLQGKRVGLEPLDSQCHGGALFAVLGGSANADIWRYMPIGPFADVAAFRDRLDRSRREQQ